MTEGANMTDERVQRYAEAMVGAYRLARLRIADPGKAANAYRNARAVMAVADDEIGTRNNSIRDHYAAQLAKTFRRAEAAEAKVLEFEATVELQRHEYGDLLRRAEHAEAKAARVEALAETYETVRPSGPKWDSVASNIRAALRGDE